MAEFKKINFVDKYAASKQMEYIFAYRIGGFWNEMLTWAANNSDISPETLAEIISNA